MSEAGHNWLPEPPLPEVRTRIPLPAGPSVLRKLLAFAGPGFLIAVGYMDPGNWATDLAGGLALQLHACCSSSCSRNLMAILLQSLSLKLGVVTGARPGAGLPRALRPAGQRSSSGSWPRWRLPPATWRR